MEMTMSIKALETVPSLGQTLMAAAAGWLRRRRDRREIADFVQLNPDEAGRVARDLQINIPALLEVTGHSTAGLKLLDLRAHQCGIDLNTLRHTQPDVARDLVRCCALCRSKSRCARGLRGDPQNETWQTYCPNRQTFDAILAH
jgi:hypothetical protein